MSKLNAMSAILKFVNGRNDNRQYLQGILDYLTDQAKTNNGKLIATQGCSQDHPLADILANKKLHNKTNGKQGEHFVLSFPPSGSDRPPDEVLNVVSNIVSTVYPEHMSVIAVHTDSKCIHAHVLLDAVNAVTGRKFSQSPSDLNRVKQKTNNILKKHGFEIITASANEFVDRTDYSNREGFDFLELDESQFITASDIEEISTFTDSISIDDTLNTFGGWDYSDCCSINYFGGYNNMNTYDNYAPCVPQTQELPAPTPTVETVPATVEMPKNSYPNTTVVTGPTFRIKGNENSNFAGLGELVSQTTAYAQEHQRESSNLALAMQQYGQQRGYPSNVAVIAGPVFDIDMTGSLMNSSVSDIANSNFDDN